MFSSHPGPPQDQVTEKICLFIKPNQVFLSLSDVRGLALLGGLVLGDAVLGVAVLGVGDSDHLNRNLLQEFSTRQKERKK